jgi:lipopolysaccharide transport system ATP-binding protein
MNKVISVEHLSKAYHLGQIGTGTLSQDLNAWWAKVHGKPNPLLRIDEVDHGNRDGEILWALKDINFNVEQGEVLGIIGRNGAGKSTLLKILSRVTAPTSGKVKVKGRIASLLEVGTGFHPDLTGRENIYLNGAIMGMRHNEIERKFEEIVDFSEVEDFIDTPVKRYSSGMYVRLAFAVAAHLDPETLLVDEVLAVGDAEFQKKCLGKMGDVAKEGRTVLFVSHNLTAISNLCGEAVLMEKGQISLLGNVESVIQSYFGKLAGQSKFPLDVRTDRQGDGKMRFLSLHFEDEDQNETRIAFPGQLFRLNIQYRASGSRELNNVSVSADFHSASGERILTVATYISGNDFEKLPLEGKLVCVIPQLFLIEGRYHIDLWVSVKGVCADYVQNAGVFDVAPLTFRGGNIQLRGSKHGFFLMPHRWTFN